MALTAYILAVTGRTSLGVAGPEAIDRFSISAATLATFSVIQLSVYAAAQIPAGLVLDRVGSRVMIAAGALLMGAGQLMLALADTMTLVLVARALIGLGDAATLVSVLRLLPVWFRPRLVPMLTQVSGILGQLGQVISAMPFLAVLLAFGWVPAFGSLAAAGLVVALLVLTLMRDLPAGSTAHPVARGRGFREGRTARRAPRTRNLAWVLHPLCHPVSRQHAAAVGCPLLYRRARAGHSAGRGAADGRRPVHDRYRDRPGRSGRTLPSPEISHRAAHRRRNTVVWSGILLPATPRTFWELTALAVVSAAGSAACTIGFDFARTSVPHAHVGAATGW